ncbi:MAG: penicillin-binding protein 2 [Alicyclobacillaceae bacterium]|nr:penicillin-binding protein 2 [Alicyclobacillaceae bacterium]
MKKDANPKLGRINFVYSLIFVAMVSLILRLGYLQIVRGDSFRTEASMSMLSHLPILPSRGRIYDTNGVLLAYDKPSFSVVLTNLKSPEQDLHKLTQQLAPVFGVKASELYQTMEKTVNGPTQVRIFQNATPAQVSYIYEHQSELPGIQVVEDPQRAYRYGDLAAHVIGYIGKITQDTYDYYVNKLHYSLDQLVGRDGVELQYEKYLQGKPGARVVQINKLGVPIKEFGLDPKPTPGDNVVLTIDAHLQAEAQQIVVDELQRVRQQYGYNPTNAEAVMLDVKTGGVLAMVSYPYYDPNWYVDPKAYLAHEKYLYDPVLTPMINHVIQSPRYPGSTVKPVNVLAGLESGVIKPDTVIYDPGYANVAGYILHNWTYPVGQGAVTPDKAITESNDTFLSYMALWMGNWHGAVPPGETLAHYLVTDRIKGLNTLFYWESLFGLGRLTGIDLPNEVAGHFETEGRVYDLDRAMKALKTKGYFDDHGVVYDLAAASIGQSQQFTPLELAQYVMTIANNGVRLQPHVLKEIVSPDGKVIKRFKTKVQARLKINPEYLKVIKEGMLGVTTSPSGTAYGSFYDAPYTAAGKTGTAQIMMGKRTDHISMFIAYAPADHPQVCIAVMVPGGGESSDTAVPLGRQLFDAYFKEHHEFFPRSQWTNDQVPSNWTQMSAYTLPETTEVSSTIP